LLAGAAAPCKIALMALRLARVGVVERCILRQATPIFNIRWGYVNPMALWRRVAIRVHMRNYGNCGDAMSMTPI
jgi:hypothetical protein